MKPRYFHPDRVTHYASRLTPWLVGLVSVLLAIVPFHAFLVVIAGTAWGHQLALASWKEVFELLIVAGVVGLAVLQRRLTWLHRGANRALLIAIACGLVASVIGEGFGVSWLAGVTAAVCARTGRVAVKRRVWGSDYFALSECSSWLQLRSSIFDAGRAKSAWGLSDIASGLAFGAESHGDPSPATFSRHGWFRDCGVWSGPELLA